MKKFCAITFAMILALSLCACGNRNNQMPTENQTTAPTRAPATTAPATTAPATTEATIIPDIPDMETNIPDPTVDDNSTTDTTDFTQDTSGSRSHDRSE